MSKKIGTGIWFIFFGIIILLHNFKIIDFNFFALINYWPLIIIAIGINIILQNKSNGPMISGIMNLAMCGFLFFIGMTSKEKMKFGNFVSYDNTQDTVGMSQIVGLPYTDSVQFASLEFVVGAATLQLDSIPTDSLITASSNSPDIGIKLKKNSTREKTKLEVLSNLKKSSNDKNLINFALSTHPIWDFEFNLGAASFNADFSKYKFSHLEINSGATSLKLGFGMPQLDSSSIEINTAASSCHITVPKDAACFIEHEGVLSSKKFEGFTKTEKGYKTENYDKATKKFIFKIAGAANSVTINRI